jgi:hypothetical protein
LSIACESSPSNGVAPVRALALDRLSNLTVAQVCFQQFTPCIMAFARTNNPFSRVARVFRGAAPELFRPMYDRAQMGRPQWKRASLFCSMEGGHGGM